jgi:phage baseplate assembly protein W
MAIESIHTDLNIHFSKNQFTSDISLVKDVYSIRQSLINIIMTIPGEKPFKRNFGTIINDSLFDNFNYVDSIPIMQQIKFTINRYEPRVQIENIIINDEPINEETPIVSGHTESSSRAIVSDNNQLFLYISYFLMKQSVDGSSLRDSISIGLTKTR